jgi:demethylmenaquinone methyltransferase/2-methoxy-6-polyprenyl-1,4-benzoquinol methylase
MKDEESLRKYYASRAKEYDNLYAIPEYQADFRLMESCVSELFSGKRVLEIACGTGYWTQFIAPQASNVVAIDMAQETLDIAKSRKGLESVNFRIADAYALPDDLRFFDAAFAGHWLSHVPRKRLRPFLTGLHAKLESGSPVLFAYNPVCFLDNVYSEGHSTPIAETDDEGNTYQFRTLRDGTTHRVLKNFPSESELTAMIEGIGKNAHYRAFKYYWMFWYEATQKPEI